ncbi:N-acetyl-gamma-glutamyl-phosphate reductase [Sulfurimonas sp. HSL3-7]|uniref:N-acetyl-gamma-glutamyl-phosphate reductase n=1 Tax=Sulfonitrofixus jiaomeiensis TaxID=3131938 RepID=UPI0031F9D277
MINVAVIGASGYTGLELIKMIVKHPVFNLAYVATSEGNIRLSELHPSLLGVAECDVEKADAAEVAKSCELAFLALPHKTAMGFVKELIARNVKVVDLSADYRLEQARYEQHYVPHIDTENLKHAVYGLPELNHEAIKKAKLVANPGCYPTASILAALPFLKYQVKGSALIVDAKSGVSGAGKKLSETTHYVTINDNAFAYNPLLHRHGPEIAEKLQLDESSVNFVPHLLPLTRGMLSSVYMQVEGDFDVMEVLKTYYKDEPYVRVRENPVDIKSVAGTNFCDIFARRNGSTLFINAAIDNLMRGASSQAIVNANLMMGLAMETGVPDIAYVP